MTETIKIDRCRLCSSHDIRPVLDLGTIPLHNGDGSEPLELVFCASCFYVQLRHTVDPERLYRNYGYESGVNQTMRLHLAEIVAQGHRLLGRRPECVVDIGANDGTLLSSYDPSIYRVGFEPCGRIAAKAIPKADAIVQDFFNADDAREAGVDRADIVTAISMFYDLADPRPFLRDVRSILAPDGIFCVQMNALESMMKMNGFDNICHEHVGYYSYPVFRNLLLSEGFTPFDVSWNDLNGGSFRVWSRRTIDEDSFEAHEDLLRPIQQPELTAFAKRIRRQRLACRATILYLRSRGAKIHLLGASTRANTLLGYYGIGDVFEACSDRNPDKAGQTTAFGVPIVTEEESRAMNPDVYFLGPWFFADEIVPRERDFLEDGGKIIVPLPRMRVVTAETLDREVRLE